MELREKVESARRIQQDRYKDEEGISCNAQMTTSMIQKYCELDADSLKLLKETSGSIKYQYLKKYPEVIKKVDDLSQKIIEKSLDTQKQINEYILAKQKIITFKYSDKNKIEEAQKLEKEKAEEEIKKIIGNQILNFERALLNQKIEDDKTMYYNETESLIWRIFNCVYFSARQEEKYVKNFEIKYKKQLSKQAKKDIAINKINASSFNWEK